MTDTTGLNTHETAPAAGWYPDPAGLPRQRWWDGIRWTEHLHDPALETYGVVAPTVIGPETPVYNPFIWTIVLLPIISLVQLAFRDPTAETILLEPGRPAFIDPLYLLSMVSGLLAYAGTVTLAFFDSRRLARLGFIHPFHWAWTFLHPAIYVIGRSVVVKRRSGRGLAAIWVWAVIFTVVIAVATVKVIELLSEFMLTSPGLVTGS